MSRNLSRRRFLMAIGLTGAGAAAIPMASQALSRLPAAEMGPVISAAPQEHGEQATAGALTTLLEGYAFFSGEEAAFIEAAVARLIPNDDLGPGALEAGVPYFIDQQLTGELGFGLAANWYMQGPFATGEPTQGYQLAYTPRTLYRQAIAAINEYTATQYGGPFASLDTAQQDEVLQGLESGSIDLDPVPATTFFNMLLTNTVEGFFSDPIYGGNRDKVGWRLVGFPGVPARGYKPLISQYRNQPYVVEPVSIAEVLQGLVTTEI
jgi:gluconate 2-dehydrogenase gamma chain